MSTGKPQQLAREVRRLRRMGRDLLILAARMERTGKYAAGSENGTSQRLAEDPEFARLYGEQGANMRWSEALAACGIHTPSEVEDDDKKLTSFLRRALAARSAGAKEGR